MSAATRRGFLGALMALPFMRAFTSSHPIDALFKQSPLMKYLRAPGPQDTYLLPAGTPVHSFPPGPEIRVVEIDGRLRGVRVDNGEFYDHGPAWVRMER